MTDQQLDLSDSSDEEESRVQALIEFKKMVRELFKMTGRSTNEFERMHNFGDGKVSTWCTEKRGPNIPPLRFVEVLAEEAQERGGLGAEAAALFKQRYGELLELYCARKQPPPSESHRKMLADYKYTVLIRELNTAMNATHNTMANLMTEMDTLREDRDDERQRRLALQQQLEELRTENDQRAADRHAVLARRDQLRAELAAYERGQQLDVRHDPGGDLGGSRTNHPQHSPWDDLGGSHANHPQAIPSGAHVLKRLPLSLKVGGAVVAAAVLVFAGIGINQSFGKNSHRPDAKGTTTTAPSQTQSGPPPQTPPGSPTTSPSPKPTSWRQVYKDRPFSMPAPGGGGCRRGLFDLDADPIKYRSQEGDIPPEVDKDAFDVEWHTFWCSSSPSNNDALDFKVQAVGLSKATAPSPSQCVLDSQTQAISNPLSGSDVDSQTILHKGASLCIETNAGNLLYLKLTKVGEDSDGYLSGFTFSATRWSRAA
ncbi:hypothetical protein [Streptomyces sp. NPDC017673]|uniref:hypothetical protein n=1 Tax=unclassified Streptomyces TaxID=2593676 RepID=UPI0037A0798C